MSYMDKPLKPQVFLTRDEVAAKWQHLLYADGIILVPKDIAQGMLGLAPGTRIDRRQLVNVRSLMGVLKPEKFD